ncbi:MAG: hypothetical protein MJZ05_00260 [Fibrobacter sp.]|nr:hypothetical protein [Fibrobacter sp.]
MKLSLIKKMMVGLAALAGVASAAADVIHVGAYTYYAMPDFPCADGCISSSNISSMGIKKFEMSMERRPVLNFVDAWKTNIAVNRRLFLSAFGKDASTTYWLRDVDHHIDYGTFDIEAGSVLSTLLLETDYKYTHSGDESEILSVDLTKFIDVVVKAANRQGFNEIRIGLADWQYKNEALGSYVSVPAVQEMETRLRNDGATYVAFVDLKLTPGSISWYASSFTHDGETTKYTESTAPTHFDFIRSKDVVNMQTTITDGSKNNVELECLNNSNGLWESKDVYYPSSGVNKIGSTLQFNDDKYESCVVNGATAKFRWKMYQSGAVDTLYTDEITLNMPYKLTLGETEHGSQKVNGDAAAGYGKAVDLQYKPDEGYQFECWQNEAGECVTSESNDAGDGWMSTSITLIGDTVLSAKFKPLQYRINWFVPSLEDGATNPWFKIYDYGTIPVAPVSLTSQVEKEDNEKYHYFVKVVPEITAVTQDQDYSIVLDSVLNDLSLHFNVNYDIGEDVSIELAEPNECLDVEKLSLRVYNDEGYSEGFALFNYKTNEWLAGGDGESGVHLWANKWNRFDAGVTLPKTGDCLNDEYVKSVNYAIQNNEDGKALVNIYINGEYSGRNRLDATNPDILFNYKFATTTYTVTWIVEGETVETDNDVVYGSKPKYDGETPTKAADDKYTYEFADWKADVEGWTAESVVKSDVKFTAQFKSTEISSSSKEEEKSSSSEKPSSSSSAKEDKSSSSTKPKSSSSSTKPKSSSSKTDAVIAAAVPQFSLSVAGRNVQIAGARIGSAYAVLDMQGRVLATGRTASASMEIAVPRAGSYMVRVGSQTKRVNVK